MISLYFTAYPRENISCSVPHLRTENIIKTKHTSFSSFGAFHLLSSLPIHSFIHSFNTHSSPSLFPKPAKYCLIDQSFIPRNFLPPLSLDSVLESMNMNMNMSDQNPGRCRCRRCCQVQKERKKGLIERFKERKAWTL